MALCCQWLDVIAQLPALSVLSLMAMSIQTLNRKLAKLTHWLERLVDFRAVRGTFIIVTCMVLGKFLNFTAPVYLAFFPAVLVIRLKQAHLPLMVKMLLPSVLSAASAVVLSELFQSHPFIVWTISLFYFDWLRRRADTPIKVAGILVPIFIWVLNIVMAQQGNRIDLPANLREICLAVLICISVTKLMFWLIPSAEPQPHYQFQPQRVTFKQRAISLGLIGTGTAFLLIVDMMSALFCLVPVIAIATQVSWQGYVSDVKRRLLTQVGGCSLAVFFTFFLSGHQDIISFYILCLAVLVYLFVWSVEQSSGDIRTIQADALLATILPIQLYISQSGMTLKGAYLRGWQLSVTLAIMFALHLLTEKKGNADPKG
ncbi:DUF2955 domain-containing protein [Shewanella sp. NFH-SH190041]|uniref:DUF2955 domain-containing protein n=1 Tax=Shewanella sp. NFH-SH190041 TaxID=2950245 RepID=UPI0021C41C6A|nr:DUF2955 domain-containing protein [Shewanella sp. NFH-SH190041]